MATFETEIRKLQPAELCTLGQILNQSDAWKKLMAIIPKDDNQNTYMFNNEHFTMIEQAVRQQQRCGADIFLSEWSTLHKKRPTCQILLDLLVKAELFRAADYLAVEVLKTNPPERPKIGPAATIDVSEKVLEELLKKQVADLKIGSEPEIEWSLHFVEKPMEIIAGHGVSKSTEHKEHSDLMKFSSDKSDMMKFSERHKEDIHDSPEQVSDLMKFSSENNPDKAEMSNYQLAAVQSEDIPMCVDNIFKSNKITSSETMTRDSDTESSIESSREYSDSILSNEQTAKSNISQNNIPVFVLEYKGKSENDSDT